VKSGDLSRVESAKKIIEEKRKTEGLDGISDITIYNAYLYELKEKQEENPAWKVHRQKLSHLQKLQKIILIIWEYYKSNKKSIVLRTSLEDHVRSCCRESFEPSEISAIFKTMLSVLENWCQEKMIDNQKWIKISKDVNVFVQAKKNLEDDYEKERKKFEINN